MAQMYAVAQSYVVAKRQKKSLLFKIRMAKLSFKMRFLQCWRSIDFNKHQHETTKIRKDKPFRDVLDLELYTREFLEERLVDFHIAGLGELLFEILFKAFHSRCSASASASLNLPHVRGMLLYGPPGCGKTVLAKNFSNFLPAKEPLLIGAHMVIGAKNGEHIMRARSFLKKAIADEKKYGAKSDMYVVVLDGLIDEVARKNKRLMRNDDSEELLERLFTLMDGPYALNNIFVIATTNRIDLVDEWVLSQGYLELHVKLDYPTEKQRCQILDMLLRRLRDNYRLDGDVNIRELALLTKGCASSSLPELITRAYSCAFKRNRYSSLDLKVRMDDLVMAAEQIRCRDEEVKMEELLRP